MTPRYCTEHGRMHGNVAIVRRSGQLGPLGRQRSDVGQKSNFTPWASGNAAE